MKKKIIILLIALAIPVFVSCGTSAKNTEALWQNAIYKENAEVGDGSKTAVLEVKIGDKTVSITIHTDCESLEDALTENNLATGEESATGLYVKSVIGVTADYDVDGSYWAFYIDGETAITGVSGAEFTEGAVYRLEYTKF